MILGLIKKLVLWVFNKLGYEISHRIDERQVASPPVDGESDSGGIPDELAAIASNKDLVGQARENYHAARALSVPDDLQLGDRWKTYAGRIRASLPSLSTPQDVISFAQTRIGFDHRADAAHEKRFASLHEEKLKSEFSQFSDRVREFSDSPLSLKNTVWNDNGRLASNVLYFQTRYVLSCLARIPSPGVICEIGGGYGGPARLWLTNPISRPHTYIIVDLPESLFFAEVFLKAHFGADVVHYVQDQGPIDDAIDKNPRILLCPVQLIENLSSIHIDLVINTGSMQEMPEEWVDFYMEWFDRQPCNFFYSLNYFGQRLDFMAEGLNLWAPRLSPRWMHRVQLINPPGVALQTNRNYAEILAERTDGGALSEEVALARAEALLCDRFFSIETLLEAMDLWRRSKSTRLAQRILETGFSSPPYPKELLYMAEKIVEDGSLGDIIICGRQTAREIRDILMRERQKGVEGVVWE